MAYLFDELPVAFPFYTSKENQVRFNVNTDEPCGASLISPFDTVPAFQIRKTATSEAVSLAQIMNADDDTLAADITTDLLTKLIYAALGGSDYITYQAYVPIAIGAGTLDLPSGEYYLKIAFPDGSILWSECFLVPLERFSIAAPADCKFLCLEWNNNSDIDPIHYDTNPTYRFPQKIWLDSNIYNSEPEIEQEGTKNGDNVLLPSFQKVSIKYRIEDVLPDFLKLAIATIPIHDNIVLATEYNKRKGTITNVSVQSKAESNGYFSEVSIRFEQPLALIKRGCGDAIPASECPAFPALPVFTVTSDATGLNVIANVPAPFKAAIYSSLTNTTGGISVPGPVYRSQLFPGPVHIPFTALYGDYITLRLDTLNCTSGFSNHVRAVPALPYHPAAMQFFYIIEHDAAFIAAGGSISSAHKGYLNQLVLGLVASGLWPKARAIYPILGSIASSQKYNLKDPRDLDAAFRLTYPNGAGFSASGTAFNKGSSQFASTHYNLATMAPSGADVAIVLDIQAVFTAGANPEGLAGAYVNNFSRLDLTFDTFSGTDLFARAFQDSTKFIDNFLISSSHVANYILSRRSNTSASFYYNGFPDVTVSTALGGSPPNADITVGKVNGLPTQSTFDGVIDFFGIFDGLTDSEAGALATIIASYKFNLGR